MAETVLTPDDKVILHCVLKSGKVVSTVLSRQVASDMIRFWHNSLERIAKSEEGYEVIEQHLNNATFTFNCIYPDSQDSFAYWACRWSELASANTEDMCKCPPDEVKGGNK